MKKTTKQLISLLISLTVLSGCTTLKEGLEGNKKSKSAEEFLIEKKNPLVLPPDFSKLPVPKNSTEEEKDSEQISLENIFKKNSKKSVKNNSKRKNSIESSVLEKIKKK